MAFDYERRPEVIERESFRQIRALTALERFKRDEEQVAMRLVHACGDPALVEALRFSDGAVNRGLAALADGAPILCDVEMVRHGLSKRLLANPSHCFLNTEATLALSKARGETRTMAALEQWRPLLRGSVAIIGNAPTALFHLLEMLEEGAAKPALIIATAVGFINAAESKSALWSLHRDLGVECIAVLGRQGGSALAAAACNSLLRINREIYF